MYCVSRAKGPLRPFPPVRQAHLATYLAAEGLRHNTSTHPRLQQQFHSLSLTQAARRASSCY